MRKHHQRQILEMLKTIKHAQDAKQYEVCQEGALALCDFIDKAFGEGSETVQHLVKYCELLFKVYNDEVGTKILDKHLIKIENGTKFELKPTRIEIAFISHKAAQSDAIESVYLAAKADNDCDAFWIPVPYIEYGKDGVADIVHYESLGFYNEKFEITDYNEYDLAARRPDAIFTFCPYNLGAKVISIHPDYYPESLREMTDMLVYIPYYINNDDVAENELSEEEFNKKIKVRNWFKIFNNPGSINAHRVILQSESVRRKYVKFFTERKDKNLNRFVALGSPKIDKAIDSKKEDFYMPDEWLEIIGSKKVFLYNSSVVGIGKEGAGGGNENYLQKAVDIIRTFMKRDDIVLWWRPHPFLLPMMKRWAPKAAEQLEHLINKFIGSGLGIFDDSFDFHRAMAWSDAYYGDLSSLWYLYAFTGKPAMRVNLAMSNLSSKNDDKSDFIKKGKYGEAFTVESLYHFGASESEDFALDDFIAFVLSDENTPEDMKMRKDAYVATYTDVEKTAGKKIFEYIKNLTLEK